MTDKHLFVSTYPPIICGIADWLRELEKNGLKSYIISFSLNSKEFLIDETYKEAYLKKENVVYSIPSIEKINKKNIIDAIKRSNFKDKIKKIIVFQDNYVWSIPKKFIETVKELKKDGWKVVVIHHGIHFQSKESEYGLKIRELVLLKDELPYIDGIITLSRGSYDAVIKAFPKYKEKVSYIHHGIYDGNWIKKLPKKVAQSLFFNILFMNLDLKRKEENKLESIMKKVLEDDYILIGYIGFFGKTKGIEDIFELADLLREKGKKVVCMYIGEIREKKRDLKKMYSLIKNKYGNQEDNLILKAYLSNKCLTLGLKSMLNILWPKDCTQSGRIARIIGVNGIAAGKDIEGYGEMLKMCRYPVSNSLEELANKITFLLEHKEEIEKIKEKCQEISKKYSFCNQAKKINLLLDMIEEGSNYKY